MNTSDNRFTAYWADECDWLVELVMLPAGESENNDVTLEWIGKLHAFAWGTNIRLLAQVGDPDVPTYELWFSFENEGDKRHFLQMVRNEGHADPDGEGEFEPADAEALSDLKNLRPVGLVFPKEDADKIRSHAVMTALGMNIEPLFD
jgi:hypothetical protein